MTVCLLPVGRNRFELYSEPPEDHQPPQSAPSSRWRQWVHRAGERWRDLVDAARRDDATGRVAQLRDRVICRLAETIAEQRTLWALGPRKHATLLFQSTLEAAAARAALDRALADAQRHHGIWLAVDLPLFIGSAVLAPIPGPNAIAYYLAFRVAGHWLAWRGARQAMRRVQWTLQPDPNLAELATLVEVPRHARSARVHEIAAQLNLPRLSAFFERVAA
jgi:hypothetical protein